MKCSTCSSEGFEISILGPDRCTFCDGTEGGNPPTPEDIAEWKARTQKPLHVRVAEALGWVHPSGVHDCCISLGEAKCCPEGYEGFAEHAKVHCIPRYDTDWAATGPLIEEHAILTSCIFDAANNRQWQAHKYFASTRCAPGMGATCLEAVCRLILILARETDLFSKERDR